MKPYRSIPIIECGEPLVPIPHDKFAFVEPHPYQSLGAPYGEASPWMLRKSVLEALERAQDKLENERPGWKIKIYDAYRPTAVQTFMVKREFERQTKETGLDPIADHDKLAALVYRVWAVPSDDPASPPPHSTGAVIDCTLCDDKGRDLEMGSPIDENSVCIVPDYYATATDPKGKMAHANRQLLHDLLHKEGFQRDPIEWWHFSLGDQLWAWVEREKTGNASIIARYGGI